MTDTVTSRLAAAEREPDDGLEPLLHQLVEHADDAVELVDIEVLEQRAGREVDVTVGTDREAGSVERVVPLQQEPVEVLVVPGRVGHEIELRSQRALMEVE